MADYKKVIADIKEHITTNNSRAITGQLLQDVLVALAEAAQLGDEELQAVLDTSITPAINTLADTKLDKTAFDKQQGENVAHISRLEEELGALAELVTDNQEDIANLPTHADVERVAIEEAARAASAVVVPTKVSELDNDSEFATKAEVATAKNEAFTNAMSYTNGVTQDKSTWVQIRQVSMTGGSGSLSVMPNAFYWVQGKVTSMSLSVYETENTQNVLEMASYAVQFTTDSTVGSFAFPRWWIFPSEPTIEPNKTYQITCVNGYALITAW